jgi:hypothetical protein
MRILSTFYVSCLWLGTPTFKNDCNITVRSLIPGPRVAKYRYSVILAQKKSFFAILDTPPLAIIF